MMADSLTSSVSSSSPVYPPNISIYFRLASSSEDRSYDFLGACEKEDFYATFQQLKYLPYSKISKSYKSEVGTNFSYGKFNVKENGKKRK